MGCGQTGPAKAVALNPRRSVRLICLKANQLLRMPLRSLRLKALDIARAYRMFPVNLWLLTRLLFFAHAAAGALGNRSSLRPLISLGGIV
jgi:hypothetical protein